MTSFFYVPTVLLTLFTMMFGVSVPAAIPSGEILPEDQDAIEDFLNGDFTWNENHIRYKRKAYRTAVQSMAYAAIFSLSNRNVDCETREFYYSKTQRKFMVVCEFDNPIKVKSYKIFTHAMMIVGLNPDKISSKYIPFLITIIPCKRPYIDRIIARDKYIPITVVPR